MSETYQSNLAEGMLGCSKDQQLNPNLAEELKEINALCEKIGARLMSRQTIATAIVNWAKRNYGMDVLVFKS